MEAASASDAAESFTAVVSAASQAAASETPYVKPALNLSQYLPSPNDLLLAGPRIANKISSFVEHHYTSFNLYPTTTETVAALPANQFAATMTSEGVQGAADAAATQRPGFASSISMESGRSLTNMLAYATSKWSLACIVMTVIVNRTQVYAATRRQLELGIWLRASLRLIPILLLTYHARLLSLSIQCQTSPDYNELRFDSLSLRPPQLSQNGGWLYETTHFLNLGISDRAACQAVQMIPAQVDEQKEDESDSARVNLKGSLSRLWPFFQTLCSSQFVEVLSCSLEGRPLRTETGLNLFEHSLAFAEAEAAISNSFGWGPFGGTDITLERPTTSDASQGEGEPEDKVKKIVINREKVLGRMNAAPEVLFVGLLSALNHITSHALAIFKRQNNYRLITTGVFGLLYMGLIGHSFFTFSLASPSRQSLLRVPTVCIIGFVPHAMILAGIVFCAFIYCSAVLLSVLATPKSIRAQRGSFWTNLLVAHHNMQVSVPLMNTRLNLQTDFYTAVLRIGLTSLAMASEAVYLNEATQVTIKPRTWLEEERLQEIERMGERWPGFSADDFVDGSKLSVRKGDADASSGFARERAQQDTSQVRPQAQIFRGGIGATERTGRMIMAFDYLLGIAKLLAGWSAVTVFKILAKFGIRWRPRWLAWLAKDKVHESKVSAKSDENIPKLLEFWLVNKDGQLELPPNDDVDVGEEMKTRLKGDSGQWSRQDDEVLDRNVYGWWLSGGWFGSRDNSGEFEPKSKELEDDLTSMISAADSLVTTRELDNWESESDNDDDGRRTPTQRSPQLSRESTPATDMPLSTLDLARLLNPQTPQQRDEARALSAHLASDTIMTRSRYRQAALLDKASVLTSTNIRPPHLKGSGKLTPDEEAEVLRHLIISRRSLAAAGKGATSSREGGAAGPSNTGAWAEQHSEATAGGPQCVVCQSAPRSIIVWPCRCLSLCDDCRVTLAMNNFDKCVCCRSDVGSFSRIFVP